MTTDFKERYRSVGELMERLGGDPRVAPTAHVTITASGVYGLGLLGALAYHLQTATGSWYGALVLLQAWP